MPSIYDTEKAENNMIEKVHDLPGDSSSSDIQDHPKVNNNSIELSKHVLTRTSTALATLTQACDTLQHLHDDVQRAVLCSRSSHQPYLPGSRVPRWLPGCGTSDILCCAYDRNWQPHLDSYHECLRQAYRIDRLKPHLPHRLHLGYICNIA